MARCFVIWAAGPLLAAAAAAQQPSAIQWSLKVEESVARAKQTRQPLMFWVLGRSASRDDRVERDQKRAFGDPLVVELSGRFVAAKLSRSRYDELLQKWNLSRRTNLEIVFVTPDGDKIDTLAPQGVRDPEVLARKMTLVYRHYRQVMFEQELKPKLEDGATPDEELGRALKLIAQFLILSADQSLIALLERETLSSAVRKEIYETLATLSTSASVELLLEHATEDEHAATALGHCTPDAAGRMLPALEDEDPFVRLAVYHAVTQICKLRGVKSDRFWDGRNQVVKRKEIERVRSLVSATAERWRQRMPNIVDLRSDTVTRPSLEMKKAMMAAEVGDDVLGDDPTVIELQQRIAALVEKEAALFVPSGTMANQLGIRAVCEPGDEIILHEFTHSYNFETGAASALAGCSIRPVPGARGVFSPDDVKRVYRPFGDHFARSRMVIVENTNNRGGGSVWPLEQIADIRQVARELDLHLHLDGARLWNASVASGCKFTDYAACADTVSMCFSKGLGAPVGSILAGPKPLIERAHRFRKMYGGAMRQAGILAAAALYAIDHNIERLAEDHENARRLADAIAELPGIRLDPHAVETNIMIFEVEPPLGTAQQVIQRLRERDIWMLSTGPTSVRAVTHLDVSRAQIDRAIEAFREICSRMPL